MMNTNTGEAQTYTPIMCHLGKGTYKRWISGTVKIGEEKHPNKETTTKSTTITTNHTLYYNSNQVCVYFQPKTKERKVSH